MARRTFFSFHYERDVWRASIVRNSAKLKQLILGGLAVGRHSGVQRDAFRFAHEVTPEVDFIVT